MADVYANLPPQTSVQATVRSPASKHEMVPRMRPSLKKRKTSHLLNMGRSTPPAAPAVSIAPDDGQLPGETMEDPFGFGSIIAAEVVASSSSSSSLSSSSTRGVSFAASDTTPVDDATMARAKLDEALRKLAKLLVSHHIAPDSAHRLLVQGCAVVPAP